MITLALGISVYLWLKAKPDISSIDIGNTLAIAMIFDFIIFIVACVFFS